MRRMLPYPILAIGLLIMWLLLQQSAGAGDILLGGLIAIVACWAMAALEPHRPKVRRFDKVLLLLALVIADIVQSNFAVARIILQGRRRAQTAGFVVIPLELTDPMGLAILACIVTATPGSAWLEYDANHSCVLIHVLDLPDEAAWIDMLKSRYETLLVEIFQ